MTTTTSRPHQISPRPATAPARPTAQPDAVQPAAAAPARPTAPPSLHLRAFFTWLAVYSMIMAVQLVLGPVLLPLPLPVRTLALTAIVVPTVVYVLLPALLRTHAAVRRRSTR
ncbi:hypothetical protein [Actinomadura gamaensis]|uniref:Uncharacterized protein n=1 Tax=Actinomadura gamaensis TaxID=1763541 RepID=A0ABV9TYM9_9ACTN